MIMNDEKTEQNPAAAGLEGVVAAETGLSRVDGIAGQLILRGHDLEDLAGRFSYEDTAALLWRDLAPLQLDAAAIRRELGLERAIAHDALAPFMAERDGLSILEAVRAGWARMADRPDGRDHLRLVAAAPVLIAGMARRARGEPPVEPDPALGQVADFLRMLSGEPADAALVAALQTYLVTVADHGMNASTFTARVVASTRAGVVSAVVAALCALKGPLHGGAPGPVLDMLDDAAAAPDMRQWLIEQLAGGERIMGFGHRIYRTRDPRADVLKAVVIALKGRDNRVAFAERLEGEILSLLAERYPGRRLDTNVEFYTALALEAIGLPRDLFTPAFALGRVLGWTAHVFEQEASGRIIRPASRYVGPLPAGVSRLAAAG